MNDEFAHALKNRSYPQTGNGGHIGVLLLVVAYPCRWDFPYRRRMHTGLLSRKNTNMSSVAAAALLIVVLFLDRKCVSKCEFTGT